MSEDIRVYWDGADCYHIFIDAAEGCIIQYGDTLEYRHFRLYGEEFSKIGRMELVYNSVEDSELKLIEDNLVVPDLDDAHLLAYNDEFKWLDGDFANWAFALCAFNSAERRTS